ncbi:MAG: DUF4388 domain-containing protein [Sandaracinaceae bacterium]|nr:DUF4388 domain-containing protein [Sandaracinaceae bacterium]
MAEPTDLVVIGDDGTVRVVGRGAERRLRDRPGRYHLVVDAPGLLILRKDVEGTDARPTRIAMAGELLTGTSTLEVINIVATANWRGDLHVMDGQHHRVLSVSQGALKYALSDSADDRLGQVLYRNGVLSRSELDALLRQVTPEKRLGQLLIEQQILTQEQLFAQLRKQVEQIFYAALLTREGYYAFSVGEEEQDHVPHHTVHLPIQQLLMEGVQRIDEMGLFRQRIPNDDLCPVPQPKVTSLSLDGNMSLVLTYADGLRTIEEIARESGLGLFHTMKSIYAMLQQGGVTLRAKREIDAAAIQALVRQFNEVLRDVFMAVATYGAVDQTRQTLETWLEGSGYAPFFGERVEEDGSISAARVVDALGSLEVDDPMEALAQGLHELAAFALFAATTTLPRDQELSLSRDVNTRLKRIRR